MTTNQLKLLHGAKPFQPFEIHLADGGVLRVPHPEFLWITPGGRTAWVALGGEPEDAATVVDLLLVTRLSVGAAGARGGAA
ncbi:MAG: hypothetical protein ACRCT8_09125 [Lacipirellulaceae bacterium]